MTKYCVRQLKTNVTFQPSSYSRLQRPSNIKRYHLPLEIVHVDGENFATISCPYCGVKKRIPAEKFKGQQHKLTVRCKCANHFDVQLNFRRYYRKSVALPGEVMIPSSNMSDWKEMTVCDLSRSAQVSYFDSIELWV